ncbi:uncharacterized protein LOC111904659 [Lactuca sativa]|uniref:Uncharacterized protein n=1 Tax=Lactuca sativa TaxID=4236 RepID=A0A9R1VNF8_LACSA|nr:uncharacterized protein LOC111904659 [Lactuca sativa]KAJ0209203.1 hypothetical protein LSAT_V11C400195540 [Lactuca sativa]
MNTKHPCSDIVVLGKFTERSCRNKNQRDEGEHKVAGNSPSRQAGFLCFLAQIKLYIFWSTNLLKHNPPPQLSLTLDLKLNTATTRLHLTLLPSLLLHGNTSIYLSLISYLNLQHTSVSLSSFLSLLMPHRSDHMQTHRLIIIVPFLIRSVQKKHRNHFLSFRWKMFQICVHVLRCFIFVCILCMV